MYFMRETGIIGGLGGSAPSTIVKVDGKDVGTVTNGGYIFVDRPAGSHTLSADAEGLMPFREPFETDVQLEAGGTYYFNVGVPRTGAPGQDLVNTLYAGGKGDQMRGHGSNLFISTVFYKLEPSVGAAEIEKLKVH
jgi:hypothetical protein